MNQMETLYGTIYACNSLLMFLYFLLKQLGKDQFLSSFGRKGIIFSILMYCIPVGIVYFFPKITKLVNGTILIIALGFAISLVIVWIRKKFLQK